MSATPAPVRSVSYGGGVQSTCLLVLAAQRSIDYRLFLFANTGDDSEHPATLEYVREVAKPYAERHGIELVELHRTRRDGTPETLYGRLTRPGSRSIPIPVRMSHNGAPGTRSCTADFKIRVVGRELRGRGASVEVPATVALGISVDEIERAHPGRDRRAPYQVRTYPLLDFGLARHDCARLIAAAGLPVPPKSACWFCPLHNREAWRRLKRDTPELFRQACELESTLNMRRGTLPCPSGGHRAVRTTADGSSDASGDPELWAAESAVAEPIEAGSPVTCRCGANVLAQDDGMYPAHNKGPVWFTRHARPLAKTVDDQLVLDGFDGCESGWCMT